MAPPGSTPPSTAEPEDEPGRSSSDRLQTLANVLTIIVALCAIGLSMWEGYENRMHNRLSVRPYLEPIEATLTSVGPMDNEFFSLAAGMDSVHAVSYVLKSAGLGPAVLKNVRVFDGEEPVFDAAQDDTAHFWGDLRQELDDLPFPVGMFKRPHPAGAFLEPGRVHDYVTLIVPMAPRGTDPLGAWPPDVIQAEVLKQRSFVFCYCSVYGEDCGMTHLGAPPPAGDVCGF